MKEEGTQVKGERKPPSEHWFAGNRLIKRAEIKREQAYRAGGTREAT
jgi:hypothetical protein